MYANEDTTNAREATRTRPDGKTLTLLGKNLNIYAQQDVPGTIDNLVDELRKHNRPSPRQTCCWRTPTRR